MKPLMILLAAVLISSSATAEKASLLLDIQPSEPVELFFHKGVRQPLLPVEGAMLFTAESASSGLEVWTSDGTLSGTRPLLDFCPGPCSSTIDPVGTVGNAAVFFVSWTSPGTGTPPLWRSDGTRPGTFPIAGRTLDGPWSCDGGLPGRSPALIGGVLFFPGRDSEGCQLWRTDGTTEGTRRVTDIPQSFTGGDFILDLTVWNGELWFATTAGNGADLWRSDGTGEGTVLVRSFRDLPAFLTPAGPRLFFVAPDEDRGEELWASDGTAAGTRLLTHFAGPQPFLEGSSENQPFFQDIDGVLYFLADDVAGGLELWRSDGTESGTRQVTAFGNAKPFSIAFERQIVKLGSRLLFVATDGVTGFRLWSSGGTPQTTAAVSGCPGGGCPVVEPDAALAELGGKAVFLGARPGQPAAVWSSDGTGSGTRTVRDLCLGHCSTDPGDLTALPGQAWFLAKGSDRSTEVWRTDGTANGTLRLAALDEHALSPNTVPFAPAVVRDLVLFAAATFPDNGQLWASDGTPEGTGPITWIQGGGLGSEPTGFASAGGAVWFAARQGTGPGAELSLWRSEGTPATTLQITSPVQPPFVISGGNVFFIRGFGSGLLRADAASGETVVLTPSDLDLLGLVPFGSGVAALFRSFPDDRSLWESDGTPAGTRKIMDLPFYAIDMAAAGQELFFSTGSGLWRSDGTPAGTREVPWEGSSLELSTLTRLGSRVFFVGYHSPEHGYRLWKIEGAAGSPQVLLPLDSSEGREPEWLTAFQGTLYFFADDEDGSLSLWKSDGTTAGTVLLRSFQAPAWLGSDGKLTPLGNRLYFALGDDAAGLELWSTDGTPEGTARVRDIVPGRGSSSPSDLAAAGDRLFFSAADEEHGVELWESDGTEAGTRVVQDIAPGVPSSQPAELTIAGGRLFFSADDGVHGREPWVLPLAQPGCQATAEALCLGGRFRVEAFWRDFQGGFGPGRAVSLTADTGYFWFFDPANVEVIVKALDGLGVNGHHWVFYGALSTVEYTLTVTDTQTGAARRYVNPPGRLSSVGDTTAFGPLGAIGSTSSLGPSAIEHEPIATARKTAAAACVPGATRLCLQGGRFAVEADWRDFQGNEGKGTAVPLAGGDTGYFWFFGADNVEVVLKVLDGRALNGKFWVFYGALSSVWYTLTVTDTETGQVKKYENPSGRLGSVADTGAF